MPQKILCESFCYNGIDACYGRTFGPLPNRLGAGRGLTGCDLIVLGPIFFGSGTFLPGEAFVFFFVPNLFGAGRLRIVFTEGERTVTFLFV